MSRSQRLRMFGLLVGCSALAVLSGCAFKPDPQSVLQPGIDATHAPPFEGRLEKQDDTWSLTFVESGNLALGPLERGKVPPGLKGGLADLPSIQGQSGWYPRDRALVSRLSDDAPDWHDLAAVLEQVKTNEAQSVSDYDQRLARVVTEYHEMRRIASNTKLPDMPDWRGEAQRIAARHGDSLARRLKNEMTIRWVDETGHGLLEHLSPEPPEDPVRIKAEYRSEWPEFTLPATPAEILNWLPAAGLAELEERARQARPRVESLTETYAAAIEENERRLNTFRERREADDFALSLRGKAVDPVGYRATVQAPGTVEKDGTIALDGPALIKVQAVNLGAYFRLMGVLPPGATLRAGPGRETRAIRKVSGPEVGYPVETRGEWTRLFDEADQPLGWVPTDKVAGPQQVIEARVQRALGGG